MARRCELEERMKQLWEEVEEGIGNRKDGSLTRLVRRCCIRSRGSLLRLKVLENGQPTSDVLLCGGGGGRFVSSRLPPALLPWHLLITIKVFKGSQVHVSSSEITKGTSSV